MNEMNRKKSQKECVCVCMCKKHLNFHLSFHFTCIGRVCVYTSYGAHTLRILCASSEHIMYTHFQINGNQIHYSHWPVVYAPSANMRWWLLCAHFDSRPVFRGRAHTDHKCAQVAFRCTDPLLRKQSDGQIRFIGAPPWRRLYHLHIDLEKSR